MRADWIVSGLSQAILCTDSEVNICYLNPAAEQLLAVKSSNVCGKPVSEALGLKDEAGGMLTAASLKDLCSQGHEARLRLLADGGAHEAELAACVARPRWGGRASGLQSHACISYLVESRQRRCGEPPRPINLFGRTKGIRAPH